MLGVWCYMDLGRSHRSPLGLPRFQRQFRSCTRLTPELLLISLYEALRHRKTAATDAAALCDTVIQKLKATNEAVIPTTEIRKTALRVLERFDKTAAAVYKARASV